MGNFLFFLGYVVFVGVVFGVFVGLMMLRGPEAWNKAPTSDFAGLRDHLARLLRSGGPWAYVTFWPVDFDGFLQFRKYFRDGGDYGIELGVPDVEWSHGFIAPLQQWCAETDTPAVTISETDWQPIDVIYIDCGRDVDQAHRLVEEVMTQVLGLPRDGPYRCYEAGIDPFGDLIEAPPAGRADDGPGSRDERGHMQQTSIRGGCLSVSPALLGGLSLFALYYGLLVRGFDLLLPLGVDWATVRLSGFGVTADVVVYDAVCIGLVLLLRNAYEWTDMGRDLWPYRIVRWVKAGAWWRFRARLIRLALRAPMLIAVLTWIQF